MLKRNFDNHKKLVIHTELDKSELELLSKVRGKVQPKSVQQLLHDKPERRRRVYLEFRCRNMRQVFSELEHAGFDMTTLKPLLSKKANQPQGGCLVTGTVQTILRFFRQKPKVLRASVDFPEYSWLSTSKENPGWLFGAPVETHPRELHLAH